MTRALPDLSPWLSLLWEARREAPAPEWAAGIENVAMPRAARVALRAPDDRCCLLADTSVAVSPAAVSRLAYRLLGAGGTGLRTKLRPELALALLAAAVEQDDEAIAGLALDLDVASQRLAAIAPFLAMPLLLACGRAWSGSIPPGWAHGHCPVCAAWPALAELRGSDGSRWLRCSRCGTAWGMGESRCPFCECPDPDRVALVASGGVPERHVEVCRRCHGYVKTVATAAAIPPGDVAVRDLLTLDLDLAALEAQLRRPAVRAQRTDIGAPNGRPAGLVASAGGG